MKKEWFVVHTYSGYENKVKANLEKRVESMGMEDYIFRIIVPMEDEVQVKDGKKRVIKRKVFPGYVLVEMRMTDDSWYVVRNTPDVTGFVGAGAKPVPLHEEEVENILRQMGMGERKYKVSFAAGDSVRITDGPFEGFLATVNEVSAEKGKLQVTISMFGGRETSLELDFSQVEQVK